MIRIFFIFLMLIVVFSACKKDAAQIMEKEYIISQNASLNVDIKKLTEKLKTAKDDIEKADLYTRLSVIHSEKGDVSASIKTASEAIKFIPKDYMSHYVLGKSYIEASRYDEAVAELETSISINAKFAPSHFELGNAYYKKFLLNAAVKEYRIASRLDNKHVKALNNLGVLLNATGSFREAESVFKQIIAADPGFAVAYKNLGILYDTKLGNKKQAAFYYNKYLEAAPNSPDRPLVKAWLQVVGG